MSSVTGYPRWQGTLSRSPRFVAIAMQETRRAINDQWARAAFTLAFFYAVLTIGQSYAIAQSGRTVHTWDAFADFLGFLRWVSLGVAAVVAGPALLDDARKGALELYLSRSVNRFEYLLGKILAAVGLTFVSIFGPALVYYAASWFVFKDQPAGWGWAILGAAGYAALWAIAISGVGLGLSCILRSSRAATLILFGGVAGMDIVLGKILGAITKSDVVNLLSPLADMHRQVTWLLPGAKAPYDLPYWWGLLVIVGLAVGGWALVWLRHPRLKGVD
jgi:ABC-type transport system involved in multi-copper enzyme maturation permease subunit